MVFLFCEINLKSYFIKTTYVPFTGICVLKAYIYSENRIHSNIETVVFDLHLGVEFYGLLFVWFFLLVMVIS